MKSSNLSSKFLIIFYTVTFILVFNVSCQAYDKHKILRPYNQDSYNPSFHNISDNDANYSQYLDESDVYYKKGMEFYRDNEYSKAIKMLSKSLEIAPDRIKTRTNLAVAYINRGTYYFNSESDYEKASNDYRSAIYYLKYDGVKLTTNLARENLEIAGNNLDNVLAKQEISKNKYARLKVAKILRGQGKFKEAVVEYNASMEGSEPEPETLEAIGDMYRAVQKPDLASKHYQNALSLDKDNAGLHLKFAKALQDLGKNDLAVREFNIALNIGETGQKQEILNALEKIWVEKIKDNPRDASSHMNLGVVLQKKEDFKGALTEYKIAESINPNDIMTRLNMGTLYQAKKEYDTAIKAYDTILQVKPDHYLTHYYKGTVLRDSGKLDEAIKEFQFVLRQKPDNKKAKDALFETVLLYENPGDVVKILETFARNNSRDPVAQFKYAFYLHSIDRFEEAMEYYHRTLRAEPTYTDAYLNIANIYKQRNQFPLSVGILEKGLAKMPDNKRIEEMLTLIKSEVATVRYQYALQMHTEGEYDKAIKEYQNIIQISESDSDLYVNLGAAYQANNDVENAISAYNKAIEINDSNSTAYYYLGTAYFGREDFEKALKAYQKALAINPDDENIKQAIDSSRQVMTDKILEKGIAQYNQGQYKDALLTLNTALISAAENADIYYHRGMVYEAMEKYPLAISDYKNAIYYNPGLDIAYYALAVNYDIMKNYVEAKIWYEKFINEADNQNDEYVKYSRERILQL